MLELTVKCVPRDTAGKTKTIKLPCDLSSTIPDSHDYMYLAETWDFFTLDDWRDLHNVNDALSKINAEVPEMEWPWLEALASAFMTDELTTEFIDTVCEQNYYFTDLTEEAKEMDCVEAACRHLAFFENIPFWTVSPIDMEAAVDALGEWLDWDMIWQEYEEGYNFTIVDNDHGTFLINTDPEA